MSRSQGIIAGTGDSSQPLQAGFVQKAFSQLTHRYTDQYSIEDYIVKSADSVLHIFPNATAATKLPLDRFSSGNALIALFSSTSNETYKNAVEVLRASIDAQARNTGGGLWYYVYPNWSYLDGLFSLGPFYTLYTALYDAGNETAWEDIRLQFDLLWTHCLSSSSGLLNHGYDASRTAVWADAGTGVSPHVWGRSLGWYAMGLVDTLELLASAAVDAVGFKKLTEDLESKFQALTAAIVEAVDPVSGAWWQVLDQPGRQGNYIESSGSSMLIYALFKGVRLGYLSDCSETNQETTYWSQIAAHAYEYVAKTFVVDNGNGTLGWNGTVSVCSLNSTASYEYYVGQPILYNSVLGSAAFVLASLEYEESLGY